MSNYQFYAVARGHKIGVFQNWSVSRNGRAVHAPAFRHTKAITADDCVAALDFGRDDAQTSITGFTGAMFKGFQTREEADAFIEKHKK